MHTLYTIKAISTMYGIKVQASHIQTLKYLVDRICDSTLSRARLEGLADVTKLTAKPGWWGLFLEVIIAEADHELFELFGKTLQLQVPTSLTRY